jgi:hypothetical protein
VALSLIPIVETHLVLGNAWQGVYPAFSDELNFARIHTIGEGHLTNGNGYYLEHADGTPLVIFGGAWLNAIPLWLGLSYNTSLLLNFFIWSLLFAASAYWLLKELRVSPWIAVGVVALLYLEACQHVWRPVNLQPIFPFYFLFYLALARFVREQSRKNIVLLTVAIGATFYLFAFLWQVVVITMGLLFLYALVRKNWHLLKATTLASVLGGLIGLPIPLYVFWLSHSSPYFWESMGRLGLVHTYIPMAEIFYSGGWVGIVLALLAALYFRVRAFRMDREFTLLALFAGVGGLGLWIMQGSNLITGIQVETGEHVRTLILPWLLFTTAGIAMFLWRRRGELSGGMRLVAVAGMALLTVGNLYFIYYNFAPFYNIKGEVDRWQTAQLYVKPLQWIDAQQKEPVVVWSDPHDYLAAVLPIYSRDFVLNNYWGMLELVPEGEIHERYLVSQYFNNPTVADLKTESEMALYLGRHDLPHEAATIAREVKVCHLMFFWDTAKDCGTTLTSQELLGDAFFSDMENKLQHDIKPNIKAYLAKYHVAYIMKDKILNPTYHPETLGAALVYTDDRYEIYSVK